MVSEQSDSSSSSGGSETDAQLGRATRRRLLRTTVNLGLGAGLVWAADAATSDGRVSITYALARSTSGTDTIRERTKRVPAGWYQSLQTAFSVQGRLVESDLSAIVGSFVVPGSYDDPSASLNVDATSDSVREEIADLVDAVPVDVDVVTDLRPPDEDWSAPGAPFEVDDLDDRRVPGGVACETDVASGTLAPALRDEGADERYFATSNHVYGNSGTKTTEHEGEPLSLRRDGESRRIGRVHRGYPRDDMVQVDPANGAVPTSEIARTTPGTVVGQYTRAGLADLMARDEQLQKVGAWSGHTTGSILGVDGVTCYTADFCRRGQLKWGAGESMTAGDSGSVNYHPDPENPDEHVLVGGINNARSWWPEADYTWGTAAYDIFEEHGLHF